MAIASSLSLWPASMSGSCPIESDIGQPLCQANTRERMRSPTSVCSRRASLMPAVDARMLGSAAIDEPLAQEVVMGLREDIPPGRSQEERPPSTGDASNRTLVILWVVGALASICTAVGAVVIVFSGLGSGEAGVSGARSGATGAGVALLLVGVAVGVPIARRLLRTLARPSGTKEDEG